MNRSRREVVNGTMVLIDFLRVSMSPSARQSVTLKMNSDWAPPAPNQNRYTDRPSIDHAYYIAIYYL